MPRRKIHLKEDKEALAFMLGIWSADGYVGIYPKSRVYRFAITLSAKERDLVDVYQDVARRLGFQFNEPRYSRREMNEIALEVNSKEVVEFLLRAGATTEKKTERNPQSHGG